MEIEGIDAYDMTLIIEELLDVVESYIEEAKE